MPWKCRDKMRECKRRLHRRNYVSNLASYRLFKRRRCSVDGCKSKDIHAHHLRDKRFNIASGLWAYAPTTFDAELAKCVPLCGDHHRAVHRGEILIDGKIPADCQPSLFPLPQAHRASA